MCSQQSKYLVSYLSGTSRNKSSDDTSWYQLTLMKQHSIASGSMPQVWSWPCSHHPEPLQDIYCILPLSTPPCLERSASTHNRSITSLPPSTLKQRLESILLSVKPRVTNNLSILSYRVKPRDLLQSFPLKHHAPSVFCTLCTETFYTGVTSSFLCY